MFYHITTREAWQSAQSQGSYQADSLQSDGFIHCSKVGQVNGSANAYFPGQHDLVLLHIDAERVQSEILYENPLGGELLFPHIYGALNLDAVLCVEPFEPGPDGIFHWQPE